jgi:hypothetical protein
MALEESPSLNSSSLSHGQVYNHFSPRRKVAIVALVSIAGLLPRELTTGRLNSRPRLMTIIHLVFVAGSFIPTIPQIAHDLHSTGPIVKYVQTATSQLSVFILF